MNESYTQEEEDHILLIMTPYNCLYKNGKYDIENIKENIKKNIKEYIKDGYDINQPFGKHQNILSLLKIYNEFENDSYEGRKDLYNFLIENGADMLWTDRDGNLPSYYASKKYCEDNHFHYCEKIYEYITSQEQNCLNARMSFKRAHIEPDSDSDN
jgi:hypothetical protein